MVFNGTDSIAQVPDTNYVVLSDLRITQRGGKVSTSSEKAETQKRGEEGCLQRRSIAELKFKMNL